MANYQKMYAILCGAVANALERLPFTAENVPARWMLERAMQRLTVEGMLTQAGADAESIKQLNRVLQGIKKDV